MDFEKYLAAFQKASKAIDNKLLDEKGIKIQTGVWLDSVVLRIQKTHWANNPDEQPHSGAAIFMGIWLNKEGLLRNRLFYNIHALRLRQLNGYALQSRAFAASFREKFKKFERFWPNVSIPPAPQTLMEGWKELDLTYLQKDVRELATQFLELEYLIEETLHEFKR